MATHVTAAGYSLHLRSIAGIESCVSFDSIDIAFDIGCCFRQAVSKSRVLITHGHTDHIHAFVSHASQRRLQGLKPATYYVPSHLIASMQSILQNFSAMSGDEIPANIVGVDPSDELIEISKEWVAKTFKTIHRVPSHGYILYRRTSKLKPEYAHLSGKEIGQLRRDGVEVTSSHLRPEIAYTGDTTADIFINATDGSVYDDLLRVKVLITEATYVDEKKTVGEARARGHIHLQQLAELEEQLQHVDAVVLTHISARYNLAQVEESVQKTLPHGLKDKIVIGYAS